MDKKDYYPGANLLKKFEANLLILKPDCFRAMEKIFTVTKGSRFQNKDWQIYGNKRSTGLAPGA